MYNVNGNQTNIFYSHLFDQKKQYIKYTLECSIEFVPKIVYID